MSKYPTLGDSANSLVEVRYEKPYEWFADRPVPRGAPSFCTDWGQAMIRPLPDAPYVFTTVPPPAQWHPWLNARPRLGWGARRVE